MVESGDAPVYVSEIGAAGFVLARKAVQELCKSADKTKQRQFS